ncbi:MAG: ABC transporter permease [Acidimicrobiales bacterium]
MLRYVARRLLWSIPILLIASIVVFIAVKASTDPSAVRAPGIRAEDVIRYRQQLGLDKPNSEQYLTWLGNFVTGDLGFSLKTRQPVWPELSTAIGNTLQLAFFAFAIYTAIGISIGMISAYKQYSWFDSITTGTSFLGLSFPPFFFGLILQIVLVLSFQDWFGDTPFFTSRMNSPGQSGFGYDRLMHLMLPALTLAVQQIAVYSRYMRASMLEVLGSDYLRTARAKGLSERRVILRHAVRNALIPVTTFAAIDIGAVMGGLVITEQVFEWPGMGKYFLQAFADGDYVRILPWMMIVVFSVILLNLVADLLYGVLDPRIRLD